MNDSSTLALSLEHLTVNLDGHLALDDVSWLVERGHHAAVLGPNGCGKSTLLSALLTYVPVSSGTLCVLGETYGKSDWRDLRKRVGLVSAGAADRIPNGSSAAEVVVSGAQATFGLWEAPTAEELEQARGVLGSLDIGHLEKRRYGTLSQGERQRVLIARAIAAKPELLILDEPCTNLDIIAREHFLAWLEAQLPRTTMTVLLVTHHPEELIPGFDEVLLLSKGRKLTSGSVHDVLTTENLSTAYGAPLTVRFDAERRRYAMWPG